MLSARYLKEVTTQDIKNAQFAVLKGLKAENNFLDALSARLPHPLRFAFNVKYSKTETNHPPV